jgi:hypothetical protein
MKAGAEIRRAKEPVHRTNNYGSVVGKLIAFRPKRVVVGLESPRGGG